MKMKIQGKGRLIILAIGLVIIIYMTYSNDYEQLSKNKYTSLNENNNLESIYELKDIYSKKRQDHIAISLTDLWCEFKQITYTGGFCLTADRIYTGGNHNWDLGLCMALEDLIGKKSIGDLGAGLGPYGRCLLRRKEPVFTLATENKTETINNAFLHGMKDYINQPQKVYSWDGFDGAGGVERLSNGFIKQRDLAEEGLWLGKKFDWVISLEVGEHIPAAYEKIYMDNLFRHSCEGIVMSWAEPGQRGHHHVNTHTLGYVKEKMSAYGMYPDEEAELELRKRSRLSWFQTNLLVFRHNQPQRCDKF